MNKKLATTLLTLLLLGAGALYAQTTDHKARFERQVMAVGITGVGVETILDRWEEEKPDDPELLEARFSWCFAKSQKSVIIPLEREKYMGREPVLSLKDSTSAIGKKNYFEDTEFDPDFFKQASRYIDKAIRLRPDELRYRFDKISSLTAYEKESPDLACEAIRTLIDYHASASVKWTYDGKEASDKVFKDAIQEYCYTFYIIGSPRSYEAFKTISEKMVSYWPKETMFLDNLGTWQLVVAKDSKQALKYYKKVLKIAPDDYIAIKNTIIIARSGKDTKLEKKFLPKLISVSTDEKEKKAAELRLESLKSRKK